MKSKIVAVAVLGLAVAGCSKIAHDSGSSGGATPTTSGSSSAGGTGSTSLVVKNFAFTPQVDTVKVGTKLTWTQMDSATHTVTDAGVFDSGDLTTGKTFSYTFTKPGTYNYICSIHNYMTGKIIVTN